MAFTAQRERRRGPALVAVCMRRKEHLARRSGAGQHFEELQPGPGQGFPAKGASKGAKSSLSPRRPACALRGGHILPTDHPKRVFLEVLTHTPEVLAAAPWEKAESKCWLLGDTGKGTAPL